MAVINNDFEEFNKFQKAFYTSVDDFSKFTHYDIMRNSVRLLTTMSKQFPVRAQQFMDVYSPEVKSVQSVQLLIALQRKFINNFNIAKVPQFIYWKSKPVKVGRASKTSKTSKNKTSLTVIEFDDETKFKIKSQMFLDEKSYHSVCQTEQIQKLGRLLSGVGVV